ncbi:hypothetical protein BLA29_014499 [Euroglyphus maynei]|uniref:Uncharacterized protein n=1 Tax=Euroglyphus maynei TaxID=6958 RepID=A0A1Y3BAE7_EURMA|nr:hypothetical protein BLA29_014499 [Euroglyphus maynei]
MVTLRLEYRCELGTESTRRCGLIVRRSIVI